MKKLILIITLAVICNYGYLYSQNTINFPDKNVRMTVNVTKDSVIPKDTFKAVIKAVEVKDSTIHEQNRTITTKQDSLVNEIAKSESIITGIKDGSITFLSLINWLYVVIFIVVTWLFNDLIEAKNTGTKLNWFNKIPKMLRSFIVGLVIAFIFYFTYTDENIRLNIFSLFISLISGMVIYKIGINNILAIVSEKFLGLDLTKEVKSEENNIKIFLDKFRCTSLENLKNYKNSLDFKNDSYTTSSVEYDCLCKVIEEKEATTNT